MKVGMDYYPEQCSESCWPNDMELMAKAGVSIVRMAEFSWSRMEPSDGDFQFTWLDRVLDLLEKNKVQAVLGTPTSTPPAWLHAQYPEIYPADQRKYRLGFGTREQRCLNSDDLRQYGKRIIQAMVNHFARHPAVVGWQTDNEFCANLCYCPACANKFHDWLRRKYGSLDKLNAAWGTAFWSQEYSDWSQIPLPWQVKCGDFHNPGLQLEFRRFQSQTTVEFQREQIALIRHRAPHHFITHNLMGLHNSLDYFELARDLDFVSWDNYPINPWGSAPLGAQLAADVMRGIKQQNVWVMEQQSGITGWNVMGRRPPEGWLRCAAWQTVAHGADTVVFFRWRSANHGTEQYWHGVLNHDGVPRRRYRELARFAREMRALSPSLDGTSPRSEVAIVNSYEQHYAMDIQPQAEGLRIWDQVERYYNALQKLGINVDVVPISADLGKYKLIIAPSWYILTSEDADRFINYVQRGGTLIVSPRTGVKDNVNACRTEPLPSLLRQMLGVEIDDYDPLGKDETSVITTEGNKYKVSVWADALLLQGAEPIAHFNGAVYPGEPVIAKNKFGAGTAYYFGTFGESALYDDLLGQILRETHVNNLMNIPEGVNAAWREKEGKSYLFLLNFNASERTVAVPEGLTALTGEAPQDGNVKLPPYGVGIYESVMHTVEVQDRDVDSRRRQSRRVAAE